MKKLFIKYKYIIILLFLSISTRTIWFFSLTSKIFQNDWTLKNSIVIKEFAWISHAFWQLSSGFGGGNIESYTYIPFMIIGMIGNFDIGQRIVFLWPLAILSLFSPYQLHRNLNFSKHISFVAALFYGFSTYFIVRNTAHIRIAFVYALAPLILSALISFVNQPKKRKFWNFVFLYQIGLFYELRLMYLLSFVILIILCFNFKIIKFQKNFKPIIINGALSISLLSIINFYWLANSILYTSSSISEVANRGLFGNHLFNIKYALTTFHFPWTGVELNYSFEAQPILFYFWIYPMVIIYSILRFKKLQNKMYFIIFLLVWVISLLLAKQSGVPFENLYLYLYENFPGFNLFRLANHMYLPLMISATTLFAYGLNQINIDVKNLNIKRVINIFIIIIILLNTFPLYSKRIQSTFINKKQPNSYNKINEIISSENSYFRTLWVPLKSNWSDYNIQNPKIDLWSDLLFNIKSSLEIEPNLTNFQNPKLYSQLFKSTAGTNYLKRAGVKYVIIPDNDNFENIFPYAGDRQDYIKEFDSLKSLKQIYNRGIVIYQLQDKGQLINFEKGFFSVSDDLNFDQLSLASKYLGYQPIVRKSEKIMINQRK